MPWFVQLLGRWRPRQGWAVLVLALVAVLCLPAAAIEGRLLAGLEPTVWLTALGLFTGWWLAYRPIPGWVASLAALVAGVVADLIWGVHALAVWPLLGQGVRRLVWWSGGQVGPAPAITFFEEQWASLTAFGQRVGWWIHGAITGQGVADNLVLIAVASLIGWGTAAWAGYWLARHGRPLVAMAPAAALLAQQVYAADKGLIWLVAFLGSTTMLLVLVRQEWLMQSWESSGTDYSPETRLEAIAIGVTMTLLVVGLASTVPFPSLRSLSDAFWRAFGDPYRQFETRMEQSFPGLRPGRSLVPASGVAAGGLPRAHLLGGRPELGQETALHVRVRGAREDDVLYWRGQTFARYNGRGWEDDWPALIDREYAAGEPWSPQRPTEGRHLVLSSVRVLAASRSVLYAAGEPVSADRPYRAVQRGPGELIALRAAGAAAHYTVLGEVADQDPDLLRAAGTAYPPHIVELYLDLPADLPRRVAEWTAEVTASAATPYDRALAIESALRQISYSLAIPPPPPEQEVVSWFLFELRQGYCDYFATAMAVMARLSGIPSRLAVGYGTGAYEPRIGAYVVTELQAHSWPELYFPGHGWVPFEPTPARVLPLRLAQALPVPFLPEDESLTVLGVEAGLAELRQLAIVEVGATARTVWVGRMIGMVNGLLICWFVSWLGRWWSGVHAARAGGEAAWRYARLAHWGARLGRPLRMADTPREYAQAVAVAAERVVRRARWRKQSVSQAASVVRAEAPRLAEAIERSLYGAELSTEPVTLNAGWRRSSLWPALRRLWFARWHI